MDPLDVCTGRKRALSKAVPQHSVSGIRDGVLPASGGVFLAGFQLSFS